MKKYVILILAMQYIEMQAYWLDTIKYWLGYSTQQQQSQQVQPQQIQQQTRQVKEQQGLSVADQDFLIHATIDDLKTERSMRIIKEIFNLIKNDEKNKFFELMRKIGDKTKIMYMFQFGIPGTGFGKGTTPIHVAAYYNRPLILSNLLDVIKLKPLVTYKQEWLDAPMNGNTALDFALLSAARANRFTFTSARTQCIELLEKEGAHRFRSIYTDLTPVWLDI